jgi:hypothetical protein
VFNKKSSMPMELMQRIKDEGKHWILASAKDLAEITYALGASFFILLA